MKYMNNAEVGEIICNRDFVVKNNVIIVDRSNEEDMSNDSPYIRKALSTTKK